MVVERVLMQEQNRDSRLRHKRKGRYGISLKELLLLTIEARDDLRRGGRNRHYNRG